MSSRSDKKTSIITLGAAGLGLGLIAYMLYSSGGGSGSYTGGGSGGGEYYLPTMAAGGYTPTPSISAGGGSGSGGLDLSGILGGGTTTANAPSISGFDIAATVGTKKAIASSQNETMQALVTGAGYQQLSQQQIGAYNQSLAALLSSEERTGGGSLQSAVNFMGIGSGAVGIANIPNSTGISNAGQTLTSVIYDTGAYEVRDWRGNIVSSGSAGAYSPSSSGGGSGGSSSATKKETVNITADKATAIRGSFVTAVSSTGAMSYTATSSSGAKKTVTTGGRSSSSGGGSSSSGMSSGGYSQGGAVRSNTTSGKYTGVK